MIFKKELKHCESTGLVFFSLFEDQRGTRRPPLNQRTTTAVKPGRTGPASSFYWPACCRLQPLSQEEVKEEEEVAKEREEGVKEEDGETQEEQEGLTASDDGVSRRSERRQAVYWSEEPSCRHIPAS